MQFTEKYIRSIKSATMRRFMRACVREAKRTSRSPQYVCDRAMDQWAKKKRRELGIVEQEVNKK